jgi:hypothetical protein
VITAIHHGGIFCVLKTNDAFIVFYVSLDESLFLWRILSTIFLSGLKRDA